MATKEALKRAKEKYDKENTTQVCLKLNLRTDVDILARLAEMSALEGGKQGYIKGLIRADIQKAEASS